MDRKEQILKATLSLASETGLSNVSLSQIAKRVGIRKASLYNHFASKEEIVSALYSFLHMQSYRRIAVPMVDMGALLKDKTAFDVLMLGVNNYWQLITDPEMKQFYRLILSERVFSQSAAQILCRETERVILGTKQLFYAMQIHGLLHFQRIDIDATAYAMALHSMMEFRLDQQVAGLETNSPLIEDYVIAFCQEHAPKPPQAVMGSSAVAP